MSLQHGYAINTRREHAGEAAAASRAKAAPAPRESPELIMLPRKIASLDAPIHHKSQEVATAHQH